jgi:hypothetical protein
VFHNYDRLWADPFPLRSEVFSLDVLVKLDLVMVGTRAQQDAAVVEVERLEAERLAALVPLPDADVEDEIVEQDSRAQPTVGRAPTRPGNAALAQMLAKSEKCRWDNFHLQSCSFKTAATMK